MLKRCIGIIYLSVLVACSNQVELQSRPQLEQYGVRQFKKATEAEAHFYYCEYDKLDAWGCTEATVKTPVTEQNVAYSPEVADTPEDKEVASIRDRVREKAKQLQASKNRNTEFDGNRDVEFDRESLESMDVSELIETSVLVTTVYFDFASHRLSENAEKALASALDDSNIKEHRVLVFGYTDSIGSQQYNDELARKRARTVVDYLLNGNIIKPSDVTANGYGLCCYVRENDKDSNRKYNRRVEVRVQPRNQGDT